MAPWRLYPKRMSENIVCYKVLSLKKNTKRKEKVGTWKRAMLITEMVRGHKQ